MPRRPPAIATATRLRRYLTPSEPPPSFGVGLLHIAALCGFAVSQPTFDLLGRNTTFFVAHRAGTADLIWFAIFWATVPVVAIGVIDGATRLASRRAWSLVHPTIVAVLVALTVLPPIVRWLDLKTIVAVLLAIAVSVGGFSLYARVGRFRDLLLWASPAPLLFALLFLMVGPVRSLAFTGDVDAVGAGIHSTTPIVMVVFDEMSLASMITPEGDLDHQRYPNFSRLARTSTWYRNAMSLTTATDRSIPTILTGRVHRSDADPVASAYPDNLFTLLGDSYRLNVLEAVTRLCPPSVCEEPPALTPDDFSTLIEDSAIAYLHLLAPADAADRWLPTIAGRWVGFGDEDTVEPDEALGGGDEVAPGEITALVQHGNRTAGVDPWLEQLRPSAEGSLNYLHLMVPHQPWVLLPDGTQYDAPRLDGFNGRNYRWGAEREAVEVGLQRYLLQSQFADRILGEVLDRLRSQEIFDDALVIVTSDHGVAFQPENSYRFRDGPTDEQIFAVPLFVKYPGQEEDRVDDRVAELTDIVPTIMDTLGARDDFAFDGTSLRADDSPRKRVANRVLDPPLPESFLPEMRAFARQVELLFPNSQDSSALYGLGPFGELVGVGLDDVDVVEPSGLRPSIENGDAYDDVDPSSGTVPALVHGTVAGADRSLDLAVAIDGVVAGTGRTFTDGDVQRFSLLLDPRHLTAGSHDIDLFRVGAGPRLAPLHP